MLPAATEIILTIVEKILENLPKIFELGVKLLVAITKGIVNSIPKLIAALPKIIENFVRFFTSHQWQILEVGLKIIGYLALGLIKAIPSLIASIPRIIAAIVRGFAYGMGDIINVGENIVKGVWRGIKNLGYWLGRKVGGFFSGVVRKAKSALGIHSPSRVFANEVGKYIPMGVDKGINKQMPQNYRKFKE